MLLQANLPPSAIATFFKRLADEGADPTGIMAHLQSHPAMGDRIEAARAATLQGAKFAPILTQDEWAALQSICD